MEPCDESTAKFMSDALLNHAREITRYARTYCVPTLANRQLEEGHREKFTRMVERMLKEMHALMLMARYKGISRFCNHEQIDAYMDAARQAISIPAPAAAAGTPALFN